MEPDVYASGCSGRTAGTMPDVPVRVDVVRRCPLTPASWFPSSPRSAAVCRKAGRAGDRCLATASWEGGYGLGGPQSGLWIPAPALSNPETLGLSEPQSTHQREVMVLCAPRAVVRVKQGAAWYRAWHVANPQRYLLPLLSLVLKLGLHP